MSSRRLVVRNMGLAILGGIGRRVFGQHRVPTVRAVSDDQNASAPGGRKQSHVSEREPANMLRMKIVLNGTWEAIENVADNAVPRQGWVPRRVPAMPVALDPPITSIWYRYSMWIPKDWLKPDRSFFLRLEKVGHYAAVYLNGRLMAKHYGQYIPFEVELTDAVEAGKKNEIAIYVHNASEEYARPGVVLKDPKDGNAYRGATTNEYERNWVGIAGNISLCWRPACHVADVFVVPSVRSSRLDARVKVAGTSGSSSHLSVRAVVLDGSEIVCVLPESPAEGAGLTILSVAWKKPTLWGPEPYGAAKLYTLRVDLMDNGVLIDRHFARFGFREVWVEGRDVFLNGKKLWMAGTYFSKLAPIIYLNDRHSQSAMTNIMQSSGLNTLHGHWDSLDETWLDLCDEMGMLVLAGFFCDGRPQIQSQADSGWGEWMAEICATWVRSVRNHPSIVVWRPTDVLPQNLSSDQARIHGLMADQVRSEDGTRPVADGSDIEAWSQGSQSNAIGQTSKGVDRGYDDGSRMAQALAASTKPFLTKEIYGGFKDIAKLSLFFREYYRKSFEGGSTGIIVQDLPVINQNKPFDIMWLSESGTGNREVQSDLSERGMPNWCDVTMPIWEPSPYSVLFASLYCEFVKNRLRPYDGGMGGELLISELEIDEVVFLVPANPAFAAAHGVRAASDGTAWFEMILPLAYTLHAHGKKAKKILVKPHALPSRPGYSYVTRLTAG